MDLRPENQAKLDAMFADPTFVVVEFVTEGRDVAARGYTSYAPLDALGKLRDVIHLVGMLTRPGVMEFTRRLELVYFPPGTPRNADFRYAVVTWEEFKFVVMTIPERSRRFAERTAAKSRLRIADGIPHVFDGPRPENVKRFPMTGDDVFTLENVKGFPYEMANDPLGRAILQHAERREMDLLDKSFRKDIDKN